MTDPASTKTGSADLAAVMDRARQIYAAAVAGINPAPEWWTAVVVTASSALQAKRYRDEIERRLMGGKIPGKARYLVVPDLGDRRIGSGGATLHALRELAREILLDPGWRKTLAEAGGPAGWWKRQRVMLIHCGGDSRRLPQYSLTGKLFSAMPVETPWGEPSTVFDEMLALSSVWVERLPSGLVVGSGDVILTFDARSVDWERPGVTGVALLQPAEIGTGHGVYVADEQGRVYTFLQKPSISEIVAAGGMREDGLTAVDSGLMRFDPEAAARLMELGGVRDKEGEVSLEDSILETTTTPENLIPEIDLYQHFTLALTGQWRPQPGDPRVFAALADALKNLPFWCSVVSGDFTHIGTTSLFRRLMTEDTEFSRLQKAERRLGATRQPGIHSAGVITDSILAGGAELKQGTVIIECNLEGPVRAAAGAVLHGLEGISGPLEVPENTVVHQLPVLLPDGRRGVVVRAYGVNDDPKTRADEATWFGRSLLESLRVLDIAPELVWPNVAPAMRTLWNADLFPVAEPREAWLCAEWMMRYGDGHYGQASWSRATRVSLATSAQWADTGALEQARARRLNAYWRTTALSLVESGADIRPLLANAPGIAALAEAGESLRSKAAAAEALAPSDAASLYYIGSLFLGQSGLAKESGELHDAAFRMVQRAVQAGTPRDTAAITSPWVCDEVTVEGPARIDLGGGWSDAPPFCLDWGGAVLNIAMLVDGLYPIRATLRRLREPLVRCVSGKGKAAEYRTCAQILSKASPGDDTSIARTALSMTGLFRAGERLENVLERMHGGLEIRTEVGLPMGSGLGTSSILAACILRGLREMAGATVDAQTLTEGVMQLEQLMTAGGGWQDQAGGIFPGAKLLFSGPGLRQRIRVQQVAWTQERQREFEERLVAYYTGIRRVARDLLQQVVGRYLARETACVQVLHSIKTLALEMCCAMQEGEWEHLGALLDRHWTLNQVLDPHTTNAPINSLLKAVRPYIYGAKLAGAGGGGFLILLARSPEEAERLRRVLRVRQTESGGSVCRFEIATEGLRVAEERRRLLR